MQGWMVLLVVAGVALMIARQVLPRRVSWKMLIAVPVILVYFAWKQLPTGPIPSGAAVAVALELAIGAACGACQATVTSVYQARGTWYMRGGWRYLVAWAVFVAGDIAIRLFLQGPAALAGAQAAGGTWISLVGAAAAWAVRAVVLALRHPELIQGAPAAAEPGS